ncbi:hypothetical protein EG329_006237 [Mollisiaceae sp. DMI_Dod_QoI]|nr:hypothetical protein EG329_006237 [Helotiales sp. DMI_Dod_QoI]
MASRFVENRNRPGSPATARAGALGDRSAAQGLKISTAKKSKTNSAPTSSLASTTLAPAYTSNPSTSRSTFAQNQYYPQQAPYSKGGFDDSSVASDFDHTVTSDLGFEPNHDDGYYENDNDILAQMTDYQSYSQSQHPQQAFPHRLQHKPSQSPIVDLKAEQDIQRQMQSSGISGRFEGQHGRSRSFELRPADDRVSGQLAAQGSSRKRSRSGERNGAPSTIYEERSSQMGDIEDEVDPRVPEVIILSERDDIEEVDSETPSNSPRKGRRVQEPPSSQPVPRVVKAAVPAPDIILPEYSDGALQKMDFAELEKEPWEKVDDKKSFQLAKPLRENSSFKDKMEHYVFKEGQDAQVAFYGQLSTDDWEEGGDWFVERFAELVNEIKNKRKEKKETTRSYEAEISAREKLVRGKSDGFDREFKAMRVGGEGILRNKKV